MIRSSKTSFKIINIFLITLFLLLVVGLYTIQVREGDKYSNIAVNNYVRLRKIQPVRGEIFDRNFVPLAVNWPVINLYIEPRKIKNQQKLFTFLKQNTKITDKQLQQVIKTYKNVYSQNLILLSDVDYATYVLISERLNYFPSIYFENESSRRYLMKSHVLGFVRKINPDEYVQLREFDYSINDKIGKSGIEKQYEDILRGKTGLKLLQKDAFENDYGLLKGELSKDVQNGSNIILSIDKRVQDFVISKIPSDSLRGFIGVMDAASGGIVAYASFPDYDNNSFVDFLDETTWDSIRNNPSTPILDRGAVAQYPPGSVFKLVSGSMGLTDGSVAKDEKIIFCNGRFKLGRKVYNDWKNHNQAFAFSDAVKHSCDVYFYSLSLRHNLDKFQEFTKQNYLTVKTEVDLPEEKSGFFPNQAWYEKYLNTGANTSGFKVNLSIGQGEVLVTPLQVLAYYNAIANDGKWIQPHFLKQVIGLDSQLIPKTKQLPLVPETIQTLKEALFITVNEKGATGGRAKSNKADVYGKTGSAQNSINPEVTHAWFSGFASYEDSPVISFVVLLENAGGGGAKAAPIAGDIVDFYMENIF